jgi:ribosomal protein S8E
MLLLFCVKALCRFADGYKQRVGETQSLSPGLKWGTATSVLQMDTVCSSEMLVSTRTSTRRHNPENIAILTVVRTAHLTFQKHASTHKHPQAINYEQTGLITIAAVIELHASRLQHKQRSADVWRQFWTRSVAKPATQCRRLTAARYGEGWGGGGGEVRRWP